MRRLLLVCCVGWALTIAGVNSAHGQFAQAVRSAAAEQPRSEPADAAASAAPESFVDRSVRLPACPHNKVLQQPHLGVPNNWSTQSLEEQASNSVNAVIVNLAYAVWQDDPAAKLGACLANMGIEPDSIGVVHRKVLPYFGTMTALVMRAGDAGVFVSFRGTDFEDPGDVMVDADCQHTENKAKLFGSKRNVRLHIGFYRAWESVAQATIALIDEQLALTSNKRVYFIGHSLGGSMAAIAALRMHHLWRGTPNTVAGVWLIGCPRVGNAGWMDEYNSQLLDRTLRISNYADFASRLPMQTQFCPLPPGTGVFDFRHVGRSLLLCPDARSGLVDWRMYPNGSEALDCGRRPDTPDLTVTTHWLGSYLDAWRRGHASARIGSSLSDNPHVLSVMCDECSLSFPFDRNKQLNVPARAGGPIGCCTSSSCSKRAAWNAVTTVGELFAKQFNPLSMCFGFVCT